MRRCFLALALLLLAGCRGKSKAREEPPEDMPLAKTPPVVEDTKSVLQERTNRTAVLASVTTTTTETTKDRPLVGAAKGTAGQQKPTAIKPPLPSALPDGSVAGAAAKAPVIVIPLSETDNSKPASPDPLNRAAAEVPDSRRASSGADTATVSAGLTPSELIQIILKSPGNRKLKITWDDVVNSEVVKNRKGSDQFYFYLVHVFNYINEGPDGFPSCDNDGICPSVL